MWIDSFQVVGLKSSFYAQYAQGQESADTWNKLKCHGNDLVQWEIPMVIYLVLLRMRRAIYFKRVVKSKLKINNIMRSGWITIEDSSKIHNFIVHFYNNNLI